MSAHRSHGRRRRQPHGEHDNEERWLLTYADMITLLMALFMVLFSIVSLNKAKLEVLSHALREAFSGKILPDGPAILQGGGAKATTAQRSVPPIPAIQPFVAQQSEPMSAAAVRAGEQQAFQRLKQQIDSYARSHGLADQIETVIDQRGLVIRLLTDQVLFDSGQADLKAQAGPLLDRLAQLLRTVSRHAIMVEGHTDDQPISGSVYPSNWELSTARASRVVRYLISRGVDSSSLAAAGYAALHPIASNATATGRSHNRRVEIVIVRSGQGAAQGGGP